MSSFKSIITSIVAFFKSSTGKQVLSVVDEAVAIIAPEFEAEIKVIIGKLPSEFASLKVAALEFVNLYKVAKGTTLSTDIAIQAVQKVYTQNSAAIVAEATKLVAKL